MGTTIQFGIACFLVLFGLSQLLQWMQHLSLPMSIFILGGAFLAIASNFDKRAGLPFSLLNQLMAAPAPDLKPADSTNVEPGQGPAADPTSAVSFTIRKPES